MAATRLKTAIIKAVAIFWPSLVLRVYVCQLFQRPKGLFASCNPHPPGNDRHIEACSDMIVRMDHGTVVAF